MSAPVALLSVADEAVRKYLMPLIVEQLTKPNELWSRWTNMTPLERYDTDWIVEPPRNSDGSIDFDRVEL